MNGAIEDKAKAEREKYIKGFNELLITMWKEQITLLDVMDSKRLLNSPISLPVSADGKFIEMSMSHEFLEYGIWQDLGVGRETYRGNAGKIDQDEKKRVARPWLSKKYFSSVMNLRDFLSDNLGREFLGVLAEALNIDTLRKSTANYKNYINKQ